MRESSQRSRFSPPSDPDFPYRWTPPHRIERWNPRTERWSLIPLETTMARWMDYTHQKEYHRPILEVAWKLYTGELPPPGMGVKVKDGLPFSLVPENLTLFPKELSRSESIKKAIESRKSWGRKRTMLSPEQEAILLNRTVGSNIKDLAVEWGVSQQYLANLRYRIRSGRMVARA